MSWARASPPNPTIKHNSVANDLISSFPQLTQDFLLAVLAGIDYRSKRIHQTCLSHFFHPERNRQARKAPPLAPPGAQEPGSVSFEAVSHAPLHPLLPATCWLLRRRALSSRHRQRHDPPHLARAQPTRHV